ncbi:MAG: TIM barrel protein [Chloroflexota bacterium]
MELKFSFYPLVFRGEPLAKSIERLARAGYTAVELPGDPEGVDVAEVRQLLAAHNMQVSSVCGRHTPGRSLINPDPAGRRATVDYVKAEVTLAAQVGAPIVVVAPTEVRETKPVASLEQEREWAAAGIREAGNFAREQGVSLVIEAWNRYETHLVNRLEQALALREAVGLDNVGVMGDIFHMNIEEHSIADAVRRAGKHLLHFHICDSNRAAPGTGHINFLPVLQALRDIDYQGYLAMEQLTVNWPHDGVTPPEFFDVYPRQSIDYINHIWSQVEDK